MQGAVHGRRLPADVLHDVDLAASRPPDAADVVAEHPESRPNALAARDLQTRRESTIRVVEFPRRLEFRGRVIATAVRLFLGRDHEVAVAVHGGVVRPVPVELELVVSEPVTLVDEVPFRRVDLAPLWTVGLVVPRS